MDVGELCKRPATTRDAVTTAGKPATILVVAYDVAKRNQLEGWLEWAGYEGLRLPGPRPAHDLPADPGKILPAA